VKEIDDLVDCRRFHWGIDQSGTVHAAPYMPEDHQNYACSAERVDPIDPVLHFVLAVCAMASSGALPGRLSATSSRHFQDQSCISVPFV
jgi:hypothetical protein